MLTTLTLTTARPGTVPVPRPDEDDPTTLVWVDYAGTPAAYFYRSNGDYWAYLPVVGGFRVGDDGSVLGIPNQGVSHELVVDTYRRTVVPMALQLLGRQAIHASAVLTAAGVIGFCADSQTGKSTVAYGLSQRGYELWADDALAFESVDGAVHTFKLPFSVRLRPASADYFGVQRAPAPDLGPDGLITVGNEQETLAALCILSRQSQGRPVEVRRLEAEAVIRTLLPHAYCFSLLDDELKRRTVQEYLWLAGRVPVYEARFTATLDELPSLLGEIERVLIPEAA